MTGMRQAAGGYLAMRRALGFSLVREGRWLMSFIGYLEQQGAAHITTELAVAWATRTRPDVNPAHWNHRLTVVHIFARHLSALDPRTEIPPAELMPRHYQRVAPYLFTPEQIDALIRAAAGMRVGEACGLDRGDVDAGVGILTIRAGKLGKARQIPLHATASQALSAYGRRRDQLCRGAQTPAFFVNVRGSRLAAAAWGRGQASACATAAGTLAAPGVQMSPKLGQRQSPLG